MTDPRVPGFGSAEPRVELQRSLLQANTAREFRAMLEKIKTATNLSFAQISMRSGTSRSSMHSLTSTKFETLPSKDQVVRFIAGCGLSKTQAEIVLGLHQKLELAEEHRNKTSSAASPTTTASTNEVVASRLRTDLMQVLRDGGQWSISEHGDGEPKVINIHVEQAPQRSSAIPHVMADLWRWTLNDPERVRHGVRMLMVLTLLVLILGGLMVFLVLRSPMTALPMVAAIASIWAVSIAARRRRSRSRRDES
jgi:hypothetical protein